MTNRFLRFGLVSGLLCAALLASAPRAEAFVGGFKVRMTLSLVVDGAPVEIVRTYKCGGAGQLFRDYRGDHSIRFIYHELPNGAAIAANLFGNDYCGRATIPAEYSPPRRRGWPALAYLENSDLARAKYYDVYKGFYLEGRSVGGHIDMTKARLRLEKVGRFARTSKDLPRPLYNRLKTIFSSRSKPNLEYPFRALRASSSPFPAWHHIKPLRDFLLSLDKPTLLLPSMPAAAPFYAKKNRVPILDLEPDERNPTHITYGSEVGDPRLNLDSGTWRREFSDEEIAAYKATGGITSFFYEGDGVWSVDGSMRSIIRYFRIEDGLDKLKPFPVIEFFGERWDTAGVESSFDDVPVIWFYNPHQKRLYRISQLYRDQLYY